MKIFKKIILLFLTPLFVITYSCKKEGEQGNEVPDYLIFGHFYGECVGEGCIEIFCLEPTRLLEDANDNYPNSTNYYTADFYELSSGQFNEVNDLMNFFPDTLLGIDDVVIGQPDYADGGGLYIEYNVGSTRDFWLIDQDKNNIPTALHEFVDKVNEKIDLINN
jgi:hypothetical protein